MGDAVKSLAEELLKGEFAGKDLIKIEVKKVGDKKQLVFDGRSTKGQPQPEPVGAGSAADGSEIFALERQSDLPPGELEDVLDDVTGHLSEVACEFGEEPTLAALQERLGTPRQYAAELRTAAGLSSESCEACRLHGPPHAADDECCG